MRYYIVSWDCEGVEFFKDITEDHPDRWAKNHLFDSIKQSEIVKVQPSFSINALKMRAMANTQRHYEIYVFTSEDTVSDRDIRQWFETDPQGFADWVRVNHSYRVYDNRASKKPVIF